MSQVRPVDIKVTGKREDIDRAVVVIRDALTASGYAIEPPKPRLTLVINTEEGTA